MRMIFLTYFFFHLLNFGNGQGDCKKTNIFYLSVGSAHYNKKYFFDVPSTINSAYVFESFMKSVGAYGKTIVSNPYSVISKQLVLGEVKKLVDTINKTIHGLNILFVYLCGHGFADKNTTLQFFAGGDIDFDVTDRENVSKIRPRCLSHYDFNEIKVRNNITKLILLFDCCYDLSATSSAEHYWTDRAIEDRKNWSDSMKKTREYFLVDPKNTRLWQEYIDKNNSACTIVTAGQPGFSVETVENPTKLKGPRLGPLCRRVLLANKRFPGRLFSVDDFVFELFKNDLDDQTNRPSGFIRDYPIRGACFTRN